jgi:hypothetical protein
MEGLGDPRPSTRPPARAGVRRLDFRRGVLARRRGLHGREEAAGNHHL